MPRTAGLARHGPSDAEGLGAYLERLCQRMPQARSYLDPSWLPESLSNPRAGGRPALPETSESGGFDGNVGKQYASVQLDPTRYMRRATGYAALVQALQRFRGPWSAGDVLLDALAGNGTFARVVERLCPEMPQYVGCDTSLTMAASGLDNGRLIFWDDARSHMLRESFADYAVASYGLHHVACADREDYVAGILRRLKPGGTIVLQDFDRGSATARWYSEFIHKYRSCGHAFTHFTQHALGSLLAKSGAIHIENHVVYDPFLLTVDDTESFECSKIRFARDMIDLFALDGLRDGSSQTSDATALFDSMEPYFRLEPRIFSELQAARPNYIEGGTLCSRGRLVTTSRREAKARLGEICAGPWCRCLPPAGPYRRRVATMRVL